MNFDYKEIVERETFLANPKYQYRVSRYGEHDFNANNKRMEIVMGIQVCLTSWMNFNYKENGGKKAFPANSKHQYRVSQCREDDSCFNNKKNGDYYEYPSFSHFTDEL